MIWYSTHPRPASVYLSALLRCKWCTAFSYYSLSCSLALSTRRQSPGPYVLVCSIHWSVHQSIHLSQSLLPLISPAGCCPALLHCAHPSPPPPPSVYHDFVKAREDERYRLNTAPVISHLCAHSSAHWAVILHRSMNGDLHSDLQ